MRAGLAGDTSLANIRHALADTLGAEATFLRAGRIAMARRPFVRRRGNAWFVGGFGGDGLALAPAIGERIAREILTVAPTGRSE
jgi:glycine/D-amino acid oxidase-like deaminating enzyme